MTLYDDVFNVWVLDVLMFKQLERVARNLHLGVELESGHLTGNSVTFHLNLILMMIDQHVGNLKCY